MPVDLIAVDRVGVGLGDDAHAGPAGVTEHGDSGVGTGEGAAQEIVGPHGGAHRPGVVTELADLGGGLVGEREAPTGGADGTAQEQGAAMTVGEDGGDRRVGDVEIVVPDEDVDAGGVAAADLHAVDRRQRLLDREVAGEGSRPGARAGEVGDRGGGAQPVPAQRPQDVAQGDRGDVGGLQLVCVEDARQGVVELGGVGVELVEPGSDRGDERLVAGEREQPGNTVQRGVDAAAPRR